MLKAHIKVLSFTDICKHSEKFQRFNMCDSQDILKVPLYQISFKLKFF